MAGVSETRGMAGAVLVGILSIALVLLTGIWAWPRSAAGSESDSNGIIAMGAGPPRGIWLADAGGGGYFRLHATEQYSFTQAFSPDGNEILYMRGQGGVNSLRIVGIDGSNDRQIVPAGSVRHADWRSDGERIMYSTWVNGVGSSVFTIDTDGFGTTEITGLPNSFEHTYSPDGTKIAFEGVWEGCWRVVIADADGTDIEAVYDGECGADISGIDWSPDGSKLVITAQVDNGPQPPWWDCAWFPTGAEILLVDVNTSEVTNLTNTLGVDTREEYQPVFSPDGTKIAFGSAGHVTCVDGVRVTEYQATNLYIMNVDGSNEAGPLTDFGQAFQTFGIHSGAGVVWQPCSATTLSCEIDPATNPSTTSTTDPGGSTSTTTTTPGTGPQDSGTFIDDNDSVFEDDIEWLAASGVTRGCNPPANDRFCPDDPVTRGQMAAFLVRALGYADDGGGDLFVDDDDSVFESDIDRLGTAEVTRGCNPPVNDRFCPGDPVTRGQMAAFLVRAMELTDAGDNPFEDDDDSVFEVDIARLAAAGITRGCNPPVNDRFCPDEPVTRGQMAAFLRRALD